MDLTRESIHELVHSLPGCFIAYHLKDGVRRLSYNEEVVKLSGYTLEECADFDPQDAGFLIYEPDRKAVHEALITGVNEGGEVNCSYRIIAKDGQLTNVWTRARRIGDLEGAPVMLCNVTVVSLDLMQYDLLNHVPVGMGIYEVYDSGMPSLKFLNDSYFEMMGFERVDSRFMGEDTISAVHPDDREVIMKGIRESFENGGYFQATVRMMSSMSAPYLWVFIEGKVAQRTGLFATYYVSFTLVDQLLKTKNELEKSQVVLNSALCSAKLRYFEYYPHLHLALEHDKTNYSGDPYRFENFPTAFFEEGFVHPEDLKSMREVFRKIDDGSAITASWQGRLKIGERFVWHDLTAVALPRRDGEDVVVCTLNDITLTKEASMAYRNHVDSIMRLNPGAISTIQLNLTDNVCGQGFSEYTNIEKLADSATVDELFEVASKNIPDPNDRAEFLKAFNRTKMLNKFENGVSLNQYEHHYVLEDGHIEWVQTNVDLIRNPITGDIEATLYTVNINQRRIEGLVISSLIEQAYDIIGIINIDTDEFFIFDRINQVYGEHRTNFSQENMDILHHFMTEKEWARKKDAVSVEEIRAQLAVHDRYDVTFFSQKETGLERKQVSYHFVNRERGSIMASIRDFTDKNLLNQFRYTARHDSVTGLYNRATTFERCRYIIETHPDEQFVMCHFDIQKFRLLNSFYGEEKGDEILSGLARLFEELASDYECSAYGRINADIFCMCYPLRNDLMHKDIKAVREWLANCLDDFFLEGRFGIYKITDTSMPIEAMFARAAIAANEIQTLTGSNHMFFTEEMEHNLQREQRITNEMYAALKDEQFKIFLQPKVSLDNEHPNGAEALVRWFHPTHGMVPPNDFIPLFETNGFITMLDRYMWKGVCKLLRKWIDTGYDPAPVSVNVSRVSMYSSTTIVYLKELIAHYKIPARLLQLELTESAYMDNQKEIYARIEELREAGFSILMDDFGSGYSSLNTLRNLPVDYLKIDTEFLSEANDERSRLVLSSVISMANSLNLPVIVEGVETREQRDFLRDIKCDYAQGFLFARPMPVDEYEKTIFSAGM